MCYKIVEQLGPESGLAWEKYIAWRGLELSRFDSVDGILRADLFIPETEEDWSNCLAEMHLPVLLNNLEYARTTNQKYLDSEIVGVEINVN